MNRYAVFLSLLSTIVISAVGSTEKRDCNSSIIRDSLLSERLSSPVMRDTVLEYIRRLLENNCQNKEMVLLEFANNNTLHGCYAIMELARIKSNCLLRFLQEKDSLITIKEWTYLINGLTVENAWQDSILGAILMNQLSSNRNASIRSLVAVYFSETAHFNTVAKAAQFLKTEPENKVRKRVVWIIMRYKDKYLDSLVRNYLTASDIPDESVPRKMKIYKRYDFLPELYIIQKKLKKEDNPLRKADAKKILNTLEEVIPYLETKKAENAEIGLPLNWGNSKPGRKEK